MRTVVVYKEASDHGRAVREFLRDFEKQTGRTLEVIDPEDPTSEQFLRAYDIVEYPTVVALAADSTMQNMWRGLPLPTISEVSYYA